MTNNPRRVAIGLAIVTVYLIWGSTYLGLRWALEGGFTAFLMGGIRFLIAGAMLYWWSIRKGAPAPTRQEWRGAAVIGAVMLLGGVGLVTIAYVNPVVVELGVTPESEMISGWTVGGLPVILLGVAIVGAAQRRGPMRRASARE